MKALLACLFALMLAACTSTDSYQSKRVVQDETFEIELEKMLESDEAKKIGLVCKMEKVPGSRLPLRVCSTAAMRTAMKNKSQEMLSDLKR